MDKCTSVNLLADVYRRLGECENLKENFQKAREEIQKTIDLLEKEEQSTTNRALSEAYFLMCCTVVYQAKAESAGEARGFLVKGMKIIKKIKADLDSAIAKVNGTESKISILVLDIA